MAYLAVPTSLTKDRTLMTLLRPSKAICFLLTTVEAVITTFAKVLDTVGYQHSIVS